MLDQQVLDAQKKFRVDSYSLSIGELMSMYQNGEIIINPEFQRYYRWSEKQKVDLIESILLNIPIPALFVYQQGDGKWEVVDGLQRLSTILEFTALLKKPDNSDEVYKPLQLKKTKYLPELDKIVWKKDELDSTDSIQISEGLKLTFRRAKLNFVIIQPGSEIGVKYEVFMRLNKGGLNATPQELRNCSMVMLNVEVYNWMRRLAGHKSFTESVCLSPAQKKKQYDMELVTKFMSIVFLGWNRQNDYHENLDDATETLIGLNTKTLKEFASEFIQVFDLICSTLGVKAFKQYGVGRYLDSMFECVTTGISKNMDDYKNVSHDKLIIFLTDKINKLWKQPSFAKVSGSGSNARTRIPHLLSFAEDYFKYDAR